MSDFTFGLLVWVILAFGITLGALAIIGSYQHSNVGSTYPKGAFTLSNTAKAPYEVHWLRYGSTVYIDWSNG
jgi:hypothetical protein